MKTYALAVSFYLIGLLVFYINRDHLRIHPWPDVYYIWEKTKDFLLMLAIYHGPRKQTALIMLMVFASLRIVWEFLKYLIQWEVQDERLVTIFFIILALIISVIFLKEAWQWRKQNSSRLF